MKITKELDTLIHDFLTNHGLSLVDDETGATISPHGFSENWNVSRPWINEENNYKTLNGAIIQLRRKS
jgi:hypothetical protein